MSRKYQQGRPTIGVLAGWQFAWTPTPLSYLDPIFRGAGLAAHDLGCNLLLGCGMGPWTGRSESLRAAWPLVSSESDFVPIGPWNTEGLIAVNPLHSESRSRYVHELRATGHPLIFVAAGEDGPSVVADNRGGVLEAMRHLVEHGHRRIAFIAGSVEDMQGDTGERLQVYHDAVEAMGLDADPHLIAWGRHVYEGGYAAMRQILASGVPLTAVLASNDESALGAIQALREAGHRTPQDVAVIGFDDRPESAVQEPALSSVRISLLKMGYRAVELLFRYLTGQAEAIESDRVETRLVARKSCGCGPRTATSGVLTSQTELPDRGIAREQLAQTMAAPVVAEAQGLPSGEIEALCQCLVDALNVSLEQGDESGFQETLEAVLREVAASGEETHVWQAAVSHLSEAVDGLPATSLALAHKILHQARIIISRAAGRQFRLHVVNQRWMLNRLGVLTARLLAAIDETQVYEMLAEHLPEMGIDTAWLALFSAEADDPVAWTTLRDITSLEQDHEQGGLHFPSRDFPPKSLLPAEEPFKLALFPLTGPRGQLGYVAFDTAHLDLYGPITQQLATALYSAQLHREATEGRRLAEEADEMKSRFLSTVSHELRTPLNLIVGLSGTLLQESYESDGPLPEPYLEDLEQIHANAQHLGRMISDVLDLASSHAGQLRLASEFVDLGEALHLVAETGRRLACEKGLDWHADLPDSGPWVRGDRTRLRQVALNLVSNAVKFTAQGSVCLGLESGPDSVTVSVCDTGMGIPPGEQASIFGEFQRSERSTAYGSGGFGLGLAISKHLVEAQGGVIGVQSSGREGAGSTFYFTLPTVEPPVSQAKPLSVSPLIEKHTLVLTNRTGSGQRLQEHLVERGFDVQTAFMDETPDWLSGLVASPPGAVVVDVSATPHQGWGVLETIKGHSTTQHLPVLFYSLSPDGGSVVELDYLIKPIEVADLTRALDQQWLIPDTDHSVKKILVVDDDPDTLDMHARIIQAHSPSHQVLRARNGLEALDLLQRKQLDLVLLDLMMPELDGFGVLEAMRENEATSRIPVIVLTGQELTERDMAHLNQGVATVLSKGLFSVEETLTHVDTALERNRKLSDEAQRLVRQAMAYIHEHYASSISRTDLARHVSLSEDYLTACFRQELGVTPIAYLNRYRVHQARRLLSDTGKTITEIAMEVGFSDSGYFSRVFRREVGVSPETYRRA